jgi:hypothetical protein
MKKRDEIDIQIRLDNIRRESEELAALLHSHPDTAAKFAKIARYTSSLSTCVRLHGQIPQEKPRPPILQAAASIHQLSQLTSSFRKSR